MNNILLIHVGMPKTGTTMLQNFLRINNNILEKYGWCYPILKDNKMSELDHWELECCGNAYNLYDDWILNNMKSEWDKGMDNVLKYLEKRNVILSAENIYQYGMNKFITDVKEKYGNIKVMIYLRRQDRAIESMYNEAVKSGNEYNTFDKYINSDVIAENCLEYEIKLDAVSQIIGKENLIVRIYEKQQLVRNDTVTDFMSALDIPLDQDRWERSSSGNFSIGGNYLEISRLMNSVRNVDGLLESQDGVWNWSDWETLTDLQNVCKKLSCSFSQNMGECGFFEADERRCFLERFAAGNERIARKYLHREDGILFYDDRMDYPMFAINQCNSFEADMLRVFAAMMYMQSQRNRNLLEKKSNEYADRLFMLENRNNELAAKLLMMEVRHRDRPPLIFGAGNKCRKLLSIVGSISGALIVDNDPAKQGMVLNGAQVLHTGSITEWKKYFVVVTCEKTGEIEEQLGNLGLIRGEDYILMKEYGI